MPANEDQIKFWNDQWRQRRAKAGRAAGAHGCQSVGERHAAIMACSLRQGRAKPCWTSAAAPAPPAWRWPMRWAHRGQSPGVDISFSQPMLELARRGRKGAASPLWLADAASDQRPFAPDHDDLLFSRFGVMFFDDPVAAAFSPICARRKAGAGGWLSSAGARCRKMNLGGERRCGRPSRFLPTMPPPDPLAPGTLPLPTPERIAILAKCRLLRARVLHRSSIEKYDGVMEWAPIWMWRHRPRPAASGADRAPLGEADRDPRQREIVAAVTEAFGVLPSRSWMGDIAPRTACWLVGSATA